MLRLIRREFGFQGVNFRESFREMDKNKDGVITKEEFEAATK